MARRSAFGRLLDHFHTHPRGRLHEFLFWAGLAVLVGALTYVGWRAGFVNTAFAWILAVVAVCLLLWSLLPRPKQRVAEPPSGRLRAEKAAAVRASKEEGKRAKAAKRGGR